MKRCSRCKQVKPYGEFHKNRAQNDGHTSECKDCRRVGGRTYYAANGDKVRARMRAYGTANRDTILAKRREYWVANRDTILARRKASYDPETERARGLWVAHRMRPEDWQALYDQQNGLCYLGQHPLPEDLKHIHVDHDHECCPRDHSCGACRRGLACHYCNTAIGMLREDPEFIRLVADNLERRQAAVRTYAASSESGTASASSASSQMHSLRG